MKVLIRKIKARLTGKYPCSFETNHGHDLDLPSIKQGSGWAWFRCKKCNAVLTYNGLLGCFDDIKERAHDDRWDCEKAA